MNRHMARRTGPHWTKWVALVLSLLVLGSMGSLAGKLTSVQKNDIGSWLPGDAESTQVIEESSRFTDSDAIPVLILYLRDSGITPADLAKAKADAARVAEVRSVANEVVGPIPSKDGKAVQLVASIDVGSAGWDKLPGAVDDVGEVVANGADGLDVRLAGPAALGADQSEAFEGIDGILLLSALVIVFVILLLTYRSLQLALLFLLCGVGAVGMAQGVVYLLAKHADLTVNGQSAGILSVLVLGAGVDYALLLVARYREELHNYEDRHEAMAHALRRAAPAILASGATVTIGSAVPDVRPDELHERPRPGRRRRHRLCPPGHDGPAAGPAGHRRPMDLLAVRPTLRCPDQERERSLGAGRPSHRASSSQRVDRHRGGARCALARHRPANATGCPTRRPSPRSNRPSTRRSPSPSTSREVPATRSSLSRTRRRPTRCAVPSTTPKASRRRRSR